MTSDPMPSLRVAPRAASLVRSALLVAAVVSASGPAFAQAPDPRVGLRAGIEDAGVAASGLELVAHVPRPEGFFNPADLGDFGFMNSDMAFRGDLLFLGNFSGLQVWDISDPASPRLRTALNCPGGQGDVSVHGDLLFMSVEETRGRVDCGPQGVEAPVSAERFRGVRIFDIRDVERPRQVAAVQTCRGSHTHTLVPDPNDLTQVYVYVSGTSGVRPGEELAGCTDAGPEDPGSSRFRVEVIRVPLANPEQAAVVRQASFLLGLTAPPAHGFTPEQLATAQAEVDSMRARGEFAVVYEGGAVSLPQPMVEEVLAAVVQQRGGSGTPTAADTAAAFGLVDQQLAQMNAPPAPDAPGPDQCHDITVYPEAGLAGGACSGYGVLLDIRDPANPTRLTAAADSNFAYWHSATFSNDGRKVIFTDEWGGGTAPRCRATDRPEWGANAIFTIGGEAGDRALDFQSYYKLPAPQTAQENCVAHNGSLVPVPGRDLMAQAWYQGGVSVFDFTDPARPVEVAYFDRGPFDAEQMMMAGYWSVYWYNGYLYASEIGRGLDVFRLTPSERLSANEIAAAGEVRADVLNPQHQTRVVWPTSVSVARAYLDQLVREGGIAPERATRVAAVLDTADDAGVPDAERFAEAARQLQDDARAPGASERLQLLATALEGLGTGRR